VLVQQADKLVTYHRELLHHLHHHHQLHDLDRVPAMHPIMMLTIAISLLVLPVWIICLLTGNCNDMLTCVEELICDVFVDSPKFFDTQLRIQNVQLAVLAFTSVIVLITFNQV
jgi:hypothetical protein